MRKKFVDEGRRKVAGPKRLLYNKRLEVLVVGGSRWRGEASGDPDGEHQSFHTVFD